MRGAALFVRRARAVAAIRKGLPGILPAAVAAALSRYHGIHARSDAGAASDLQRVGQARHLLGAFGAGLFRDHPQGARRGENPARLCPSQRPAQCRAGRGARRLRQGQFRSRTGRYRGGLRQSPFDRHPHLSVERSAIPRLPGGGQARLPARSNRNAAGARRLSAGRAALNYQHAFHAGNFADVHKHAVLARILSYLKAKPAAFRVIDTHAGAGRYDLRSAEATRGGEWQDGIGRLLGRPLPEELKALLAPYLDVVQNLNPGGTLRVYSGSPLRSVRLLRAQGARALLRPQDRLIACELEPRAAAALKAVLHDRRAKVLALDGWTALGAYVPPKERRGVVLVAPPFEEAADFTRLASALAAAHRKWPTGIYVLWYPIKERDAPDALARRLRPP